MVAVATWSSRLRDWKVRFNCDKEAVANAWQRMSAKHPQTVALLRHLFLLAGQNNFQCTLSMCRERRMLLVISY